MRVLPGRHPAPRGPRPRRARAGGRGRRAHGPRLRGGHGRRPRRPGRRRRLGPSPATIAAIRRRTPAVQVEVLIPDCKGDEAALATIFDARPDVLNHNLETVARLQRAVRPSAGYARCLAVLARAKAAGPDHQVGPHRRHGRDRRRGAAAPRRPARRRRRHRHHRPVPAADRPPPAGGAVGGRPPTFDALRRTARRWASPHVESGPLTRSSYHARQAAGSTAPAPSPRLGLTARAFCQT